MRYSYVALKMEENCTARKDFLKAKIFSRLIN